MTRDKGSWEQTFLFHQSDQFLYDIFLALRMERVVVFEDVGIEDVASARKQFVDLRAVHVQMLGNALNAEYGKEQGIAVHFGRFIHHESPVNSKNHTMSAADFQFSRQLEKCLCSVPFVLRKVKKKARLLFCS
jgi:hypothetical protein